MEPTQKDWREDSRRSVSKEECAALKTSGEQMKVPGIYSSSTVSADEIQEEGQNPRNS